MADRPLDEVRRLLGPRLQEVAGARLTAEIPLSEALVNRLVAELLRKYPDAPVETATVQLGGAGAMSVRVRLRRPRLLPPFVLRLHIEHQPTPELPHLVLRWELAGMSAVTAIAAPVLAFLKAGRGGVTVEGERIVIDIVHVLREQGAGEILDHLRSVRVDTRPGELVIAFELRVAESPGKSAP